MADTIESEWITARDEFLFAWRMYVPQDPIVRYGRIGYTPAYWAEKCLRSFTHEGQGYSIDTKGCGGGRMGSEPNTDEERDCKATMRAKLCLFGLLDLYPHLDGTMRAAAERLMIAHREFWPLADSYYACDPRLGPLTLQAAA